MVIVLINGAQACNVFWQIKGAMNSSPNTSLKGTFITSSSAIDLGSGTTLEGRALTYTAGAITVNSVLTYLPTGCGSPMLNGPGKPVMGRAACYTLFTGSGNNTNAGNTVTSGDVGSNAGSTMGYDPLLVSGTIHPSPDASTSGCNTDLQTVYTYLNNLTADIELLYPAQFGNDLVLTPHTYLLGAATMLTGTLYLNAQGNPDAVFVMKISGAFSTSVQAKVVLMNGAQAQNVFWKIDGALTLNDYSDFKGTFVVDGGAITLNTGVNLVGRALTLIGAFTANTDTVTLSEPCPTILSMDLLFFNGNYRNHQIDLLWSVSQFMDEGYFTIDRSPDATHFETMGIVSVNVEDGNQLYQFSDSDPYPVSYYRITHTEISGKRFISPTIRIKAAISQNDNGWGLFNGGLHHGKVFWKC